MDTSLFSPVGPQSVIRRGSLIQFQYAFRKPGHDPAPLVLVTDVWPQAIRGVNLHYLTLPTIKTLLQRNAGNPSFSYGTFKGDSYIVSAFRQYKRPGVRGVRMLDQTFLSRIMNSVRTFSPSEVEAIRESVRRQIQETTQPQAAATPPQL